MNKPTFDGTMRIRPRINVPRGYTGNEPGSITLSAPLSRAILNTTSSNTIYSGQPVVRDSEGGFITPGLADPGTAAVVADVLATQVYFAYADSTDTDVLSANLLLGFAAIGKFEIESAWVDLTNLANGSRLVVGNNGLLQDQGTAHDNSVVGIVTEIRDLGVKGHTSLIDLDDSQGAENTNPNVRGGVIKKDDQDEWTGTIGEDGTSNVYPDGLGGADSIKIVKFVTVG